MAKGKVVRAISGFFDVFDGQIVRRCRARGVFKKHGITVLVGDEVEFDPIGGREGIVVGVEKRTTELIRPPVANVNHVLVVFSFVTPDLNFYMLDKTITAALVAGVQPSVVFTKSDLAEEAMTEKVCAIYRACGFQTLKVAAKFGVHVEDVRQLMQGKINVFAGPSGAGKSTLANALDPSLGLQMGQVSEKIGRGKQTTRHVELFRLDDETWVADAPGFSQLQIQVPSRKLKLYFPDFGEVASECAYRGCSHTDEQDCGVKRAVSEQRIAPSRYESYQQIFAETREREETMY